MDLYTTLGLSGVGLLIVGFLYFRGRADIKDVTEAKVKQEATQNELDASREAQTIRDHIAHDADARNKLRDKYREP